jgi:hypothetical protein
MREYFGVSLGAKTVITAADEIVSERLIIFDHSVVDERKLTARVEVRVRIFVSHFAMRGPTRVANAE